MGSFFSSTSKTEAADDAVKAASAAWVQVSADLHLALQTTDEARDAVDSVLRRYDNSKAFGKKGVANAVKQFADKIRKTAKGSSLSKRQRGRLIRLRHEVNAFDHVLKAAAAKNSQVGGNLSVLIAKFQAALGTLHDLTNDEPPAPPAPSAPPDPIAPPMYASFVDLA